MGPVARRIAETAAPPPGWGCPWGGWGGWGGWAAHRPASAFRVRHRASWPYPPGPGCPGPFGPPPDTRGRTDQDPRQAVRDRPAPLARLLRVLRPSPARPDRSRCLGGRARTIPGSLVRIRPRPVRTGARLAHRDPRRHRDTAARPRHWPASPARMSPSLVLPPRTRPRGTPLARTPRPCRPRLRGSELPRPVLLGPVRARPALFGAMLFRPVPVSTVLPGAALLRPILLSAVRLRTVLVRPVPAGVVLLSPVLLRPRTARPCHWPDRTAQARTAQVRTAQALDWPE